MVRSALFPPSLLPRNACNGVLMPDVGDLALLLSTLLTRNDLSGPPNDHYYLSVPKPREYISLTLLM